MLFDTHAHICSPRFAIEEQLMIINNAQAASVGGMVHISTDSQALHEGLALANIAPKNWIHKIAASTTPHDATVAEDHFFEEVRESAEKGLLCAIGETGLDYHYHADTKQFQRLYFQKYAELAVETNLPIIIHTRDAFCDLFPILQEYGASLRGVIHCFTGTTDEALSLCALGYYISVSGIVTFNKSTALHETVTKIPIDHLLIETDAPYLAPEPHRGERNEPAFLPYIAKKVAALRNMPFEEVAQITTRNAHRLFMKERTTSL